MKSRHEYYKARRARLKAQKVCVRCAVSKPALGKVTCVACLERHKWLNQRWQKLAEHRKVDHWGLPASELSNEELYRRAKAERELVSWAWSHPA